MMKQYYEQFDSFGKFLRQTRINAKIKSGADLARRTGISQSHISALETDKKFPSAKVLNKLLEVFPENVYRVSRARRYFLKVEAGEIEPDEQEETPTDIENQTGILIYFDGNGEVESVHSDNLADIEIIGLLEIIKSRVLKRNH